MSAQPDDAVGGLAPDRPRILGRRAPRRRRSKSCLRAFGFRTALAGESYLAWLEAYGRRPRNPHCLRQLFAL